MMRRAVARPSRPPAAAGGQGAHATNAFALSRDHPSATHPDTQERLQKIDAEIASLPPSVGSLPVNEPHYNLMKKRLPPPAADTTAAKK